MNFADLLRPGGAARALIARYHLEYMLTSAGSITGHQSEQAELGLAGRPPDGGRLNSQEILRSRLADLALLCRDFNALEERCCRLRYSFSAGTVGYTAVRRLSDLFEGDGEEVTNVRPHDHDGHPMDGFVAVRGVQTKFPGYDLIGERVQRTAGQVRGILDDARRKIDTAVRWRAFASDLESRYE